MKNIPSIEILNLGKATKLILNNHTIKEAPLSPISQENLCLVNSIETTNLELMEIEATNLESMVIEATNLESMVIEAINLELITEKIALNHRLQVVQVVANIISYLLLKVLYLVIVSTR